MLLFVDIRRGGGSSEEISTEEENSSENEQNSGESDKNVDNSSNLSTSSGSGSSGSSESGESSFGTTGSGASGSSASGNGENSNSSVASSETGSQVNATSVDLGVYASVTDTNGNTVDFWLSYCTTDFLDEAAGTSSDPYIIDSEEDLAGISYLVFSDYSIFSGCYFEQTCDLDLSAHTWMPIGGYNADGNASISFYSGDYEHYYFSGRYDGNGHSISGISVFYNEDSSYIGNAGLFGVVHGAIIHDLVLKDSTIRGAGNAGALISFCHDSSTLYNITNYCDVWSRSGRAGGIAGAFNSGKAYNCVNYGSVTGTTCVGGIFGYVYWHCTVYNLTNYGTVTGVDQVGGITGKFQFGDNFYCCVNYGNVVGTGERVGGIIGYTYEGYTRPLYIRQNANYGAVSGVTYVGGILGYACENTYLYDCLNEADVTSTGLYAGGIVGYSNSKCGSIVAVCRYTNLINLGAVTSAGYSGGIVGYIYDYYSSDSYNGTTYVYNCVNLGAVVGLTPGGLVGYTGVNDTSYTQTYVGYCAVGGDCETSSWQGEGYVSCTYTLMIEDDSCTSCWGTFQSKSFWMSGVWNSDYAWDFDSVWSINVFQNDGLPFLVDITPSVLSYDSTEGCWLLEDGKFPQSLVDDDLADELEDGATLTGEVYVIGGETFSVWAYESEEYVKVKADGTNGTAGSTGCSWFLVEPIVWIVSYGEDEPTEMNLENAVSLLVVTCGSYKAKATSSVTWSSLYSSTTSNSNAALVAGNLTCSQIDSVTYDLFNTTASQTAVYSVNLGNVTSSNTTVTSAGYRVASVSEIDALGVGYAATCSDLVAFLLSGGTKTSGYVVDYWTRDLAFELDETSYYGSVHGASLYSGQYNQGVYVTGDGVLSNATLTNNFGARLSMTLSTTTFEDVLDVFDYYSSDETYTLAAGKKVPTLNSPYATLEAGTYYLVFDVYAEDEVLFNVDLYPDTLPEVFFTATTETQHMIWKITVEKSVSCRLRFFQNLYGASTENPYNIYISNIHFWKAS